MAMQKAIPAFGLALIALSIKEVVAYTGSVARALALTKIKVSVNEYAVFKVQEDCSSHFPTARTFAKSDIFERKVFILFTFLKTQTDKNVQISYTRQI